ncbi:MAG: GNAT family N-acetyltransferase [Hyphomicrobium sp.]
MPTSSSKASPRAAEHPRWRAQDIAFERVSHDDLPMLSDWLSRPHWREWWGDPVIELGYIRDMIEGRDGTRPYIFHVDGAAAGYIQAWDIGPHQVEEWSRDNPWLMELPSDAVGVDLSIASPDRLSKGLGSAVLRTFAAQLRRQGSSTIIIDPDPENVRAVRAYRKAGFEPVPHLEGRTPGVLILQYQPDREPA